MWGQLLNKIHLDFLKCVMKLCGTTKKEMFTDGLPVIKTRRFQPVVQSAHLSHYRTDLLLSVDTPAGADSRLCRNLYNSCQTLFSVHHATE